MARGRQFPARPGPKRQVTWIGPADQGYLPVATNTKVIIASFDPAANGFLKPTVVRTRGEVSLGPGAGVESDVEIVAAYGLCVVSDQALAAGAASIPDPFDDAGWDGWFVWRSIHLTQEASGTPATITLNSVQQEVDSKAMRKVSDNESIILMAASQGGAFRIAMSVRLLLKVS